MTRKKRQTRPRVHALLAITLLIVTAIVQETRRNVTANILATQPPARVTAREYAQSIERQAVRLSYRVRRRFRINPAIDLLADALRMRQQWLARRLPVTFTAGDAVLDLPPWEINLHRYPHWLTFSPSPVRPEFLLDADAVRATLATGNPDELPTPAHGTAGNVRDDKGVLRVDAQGHPSDGYQMDVDRAVSAIVDALEDDADHLTIEATFVRGHFTLMTDEGEKELVLLSHGKSNFAHSPWARVKNIQKAMRDHVNNILVPQGTEFSFNDTLGGPVTQGRGWYEALIIVNGKDLAPAPGGGICQAATTVYRAAVLAGLPITQRYNHSLYVTYYEKGGVGIDSTIYPGGRNLTFVNDTPDTLLIQAGTDGNDADVRIYGVSDGRSIALEGPFFKSTAPEGFAVNGRTLASNEIAWRQHVTFRDGRTDERLVLSHYKQLPQSLAAKYPPSTVVPEVVHAAAQDTRTALTGMVP